MISWIKLRPLCGAAHREQNSLIFLVTKEVVAYEPMQQYHLACWIETRWHTVENPVLYKAANQKHSD